MFAYGTVLLCVLALAGTAWGMTLEGEFGMMWNETENSTLNHTETMNVTMETPGEPQNSHWGGWDRSISFL